MVAAIINTGDLKITREKRTVNTEDLKIMKGKRLWQLPPT
jgi:hypothetical protein